MKNIYVDSPLTEFAGKTYHWFSTDSKERFIKNIKEHPDKLREYGWLERKITYNINNQGFRGLNFTDDSSIIFLGCSHTFGDGVGYEDTWPYLMSSELKLQCMNLAITGGSSDCAFRLAYHYIPKVQPKLVVMLSPYDTRLELIEENTAYRITSFTDKLGFKKSWLGFYNSWMSDDTNLILNREKNVFAISEICRRHDVKFLNLSHIHIPQLDLARDLHHYGVKSHKKLSEMFLSMV